MALLTEAPTREQPQESGVAHRRGLPAADRSAGLLPYMQLGRVGAVHLGVAGQKSSSGQLVSQARVGDGEVRSRRKETLREVARE